MPTNAAATGFWSAQNRNNARQGRALLQGIYANNDATPLNGTRSGVVVTTGLTLMSDLLVQVTSGLNMTVAPGVAVAHRSGQGPYEGWLLSSAAIACDPAPATNPRNDIVIMRWYDSTQGDTSPDGNPCRIEIITGTPGAVPVDPIAVNSLGVYTSFPTSGGGIGIPLARAQVSTAGVITLTLLRRSAGIPGTVRILLEGDSDSGGRVGDMRYSSTTDLFEVKDSLGTWQRMAFGDSVPRGTVGITNRATTDAVSSTEVMMDTRSVSVVSGRRYKITFSCVQSSNLAAGPPNATVNIRSASGGSVTTSSGLIRAANIRVFSGTNELFEMTAVYVATATETRTFGVSATSNGGAATNTFQGGGGRLLLIEDIGI